LNLYSSQWDVELLKVKGSSVTFEKAGVKVFFHRPHPQKEALRYRVKDVHLFLQKIGIQP
jgi:hypothetical protein